MKKQKKRKDNVKKYQKYSELLGGETLAVCRRFRYNFL